MSIYLELTRQFNVGGLRAIISIPMASSFANRHGQRGVTVSARRLSQNREGSGNPDVQALPGAGVSGVGLSACPPKPRRRRETAIGSELKAYSKATL